jgi:hypothetical protein
MAKKLNQQDTQNYLCTSFKAAEVCFIKLRTFLP